MIVYLVAFLTAVCGLPLKHVTAPPSARLPREFPSAGTLDRLKGVLRERVLGDNRVELSRYLPYEKEELLSLESRLEAKMTEFASDTAFESNFYLTVSSCVNQSMNGFDPFRSCKFSELVREETQSYITDISTKMLDFTDETLMTETLEQVLELCLWGTRKEILELSPKPALSAVERNAAAFGNNPEFTVQERKITPRMKKTMFNNALRDNRRLIQRDPSSMDVDSVTHVSDFLQNMLKEDGEREVHIITDKVGHGLVADLLLGHVLLSLNICSLVSYHCRPYSSGNVLSVTGADVSGTIEQMADPTKGRDLWNVRHFGEALRRHVVTGQMRIEVDDFWCATHMPLWEIPDHLAKKFEEGACTFVKGDDTYRRMLGDIDWPEGSSPQDMLSYWPSSLCVLRTRGARGAVTLMER